MTKTRSRPTLTMPKALHAMTMSVDRIRYIGVGCWLTLVALSFLGITSCRSTHPGHTQVAPNHDRAWPQPNVPWDEKSYPVLKVAYPEVADATYVNEDSLCNVCHKTHVEMFEYNVHRNHGCETCHGPASRHLESRGTAPGSILSFKKIKRAERSEVCLKCHEQDGCAPGLEWRTSAHAHHGVSCTDCHNSHYNVPEGTVAVPVDQAVFTESSDEDWQNLVRLATSQSALPETEAPLPSLRGTSNSLGAIAPQVCYQCHSEKHELERVAHPHQVNGKHGFNCTSCHNPHGNVLASSRKEMCLECHTNSPTASWHSSIHDQAGVACTDCHNPHPRTNVQDLRTISHTDVRRPARLPMAVDEFQACGKCHSQIVGMMRLPSHHPVREGKMSCSDCHDAHGQMEGNLKGETLNATCYRCHADKQGPFVYEHPPVNEDCSICHNPHGTVADNLLHQQTAFLCLRCHSGHRAPPSSHFGIGTSNIDPFTWQRPVLYTDCSQCHKQIHGSDHPSQRRAGALMR